MKDTPGLHRRTDREQVVGFDKRLSAEAVASNKAYTKAMQTDTIKLKDTYIVKKLSAKGKNYKVVDKTTELSMNFHLVLVYRTQKYLPVRVHGIRCMRALQKN